MLASNSIRRSSKSRYNSRFKSHLLDYDMFSQPIQFNINGKKNHRTYSGLILSVIFILAVMSISMIEFLKYLGRDAPTTTMDNRTVKVYEKINLRDSDFIPALLFYTGGDVSIQANEISQYYTISWKKSIWEIKDTEVDGPLEYLFKSMFYDVVPCGELPRNQTKYSEDDPTISKVIKTDALCPIMDDTFSVAGRGSDKVYETISLVIQPCSLPSGQCKNAQDLKYSYVQVLYPSYTLNFSNFETPRAPFLQSEDYYTIDINSKQMYSMKLRTNQILDYLGLVPKWIEKDKYVDAGNIRRESVGRDNNQIQCSKLTYTDAIQCVPYMEFIFQSSADLRVMYRRYITSIETLGAIGGSVSVIFSIFSIMMAIVLASGGPDFLANKVFPLIYTDNLGEISEKYQFLQLDDNLSGEEFKSCSEARPKDCAKDKYTTKSSNKCLPTNIKNSKNGAEDNSQDDPQDNPKENLQDYPQNKFFTDGKFSVPIHASTSSDTRKIKKDQMLDFPDFEQGNEDLQLHYSMFNKLWVCKTKKCRCSRKKQAKIEDEQEAIDKQLATIAKRRALYECVWENLDIVNLVKTMVEMKVIMKDVLKSRQEDLLQIAGFKEWIKSRKIQVESNSMVEDYYQKSQKGKCMGCCEMFCKFWKDAKIDEIECYIKYEKARQCYKYGSNRITDDDCDELASKEIGLSLKYDSSLKSKNYSTTSIKKEVTQDLYLSLSQIQCAELEHTDKPLQNEHAQQNLIIQGQHDAEKLAGINTLSRVEFGNNL